MSFMQFLAILRARMRLALIVLTTILVLAALLSVLLPKTWNATGSLVLDFRTTDPISGQTLPSIQMVTSYIATQIDVITSQRVAGQVVDTLKLASNPTVRAQFSGESEAAVREALAERLLKKLTVKPGRDSTVLEVSFSGSDPDYAAAMVNAFIDAYLATNIELRVEPARHNAKWFNEQMKSLRDNLERAQARLSEYQRSKGIVATEERIDLESMRLSELSTQLVQAQTQTYDSASRHAQAAGGGATAEVVANQLIQTLKAELARQEAKLSELGQRFGHNHPEYERAVAERDQMRRKLEQETATVTSSMGGTVRVARQREGDLRTALAEQKAKVMKLKQDRDQMTLYARDVETAQRAFETAMQRSDKTFLESRSNQADVAVLNRAVAPSRPSSPKLGLNMLLAAIIGTFVAVAVAFGAEMRDRRVRVAQDAADILQLPILGTVGRQKLQRPLLARLRGRLLSSRVEPSLPL